jgi:hypothetical protein
MESALIRGKYRQNGDFFPAYLNTGKTKPLEINPGAFQGREIIRQP